MNIKEVVISTIFNALVILVIFFAVRAIIGWVWGGPKEGSFIAPQGEVAIRPLKTEVDFIDSKPTEEPTRTEVTTEYGQLTFTTDGAVLSRLGFNKRVKNGVYIIPTVSGIEGERENGCFLVALDEKTPYLYRLVEKNESEDRVTLVYQVDIEGGVLSKTFTVFKKVPRLELQLKLDVQGEHAYAPRVLFPGPLVPEMASYDVSSCLYGLTSTEVHKIARSSLDEQQGWLKPLLFGADDKFFVHTLLRDENQFCQRAYFKLFGQQGILNILEGPTVQQSTTWNFAFYCGPKLMQAMAAVDPRLEKTLDYSGLLAPLAHLMLAILAFFYAYVRNYGLAIILLTVLIKLLLLPMSWRAERMRKKSAEYQKKLEYIQQRYKHDPALLEQEKLELMRREGMWRQLGGCLPLLAQIPVFWVLSRVISGSFELYKEPFFGWITDLSAKDPYYILPLMLMLLMMLNAVYVDPKQRLGVIVGGFVFGLFSTAFSAGLALYFVTFNLLTVVQNEVQKYLK